MHKVVHILWMIALAIVIVSSTRSNAQDDMLRTEMKSIALTIQSIDLVLHMRCDLAGSSLKKNEQFVAYISKSILIFCTFLTLRRQPGLGFKITSASRFSKFCDDNFKNTN
jgi:hypothetical protein